MQEKENILRIFQETKEAINKGDSAIIKNLSNQTINTASLTHDPDNIAVAVIVYSLSKIIEREDYRKLSGWNNFYKTYIAKNKTESKKIRKKLHNYGIFSIRFSNATKHRKLMGWISGLLSI